MSRSRMPHPQQFSPTHPVAPAKPNLRLALQGFSTALQHYVEASERMREHALRSRALADNIRQSAGRLREGMQRIDPSATPVGN